MIHESAPWKSHLLRDASLIERWAAKPERSERKSFLIERKVFLAAYAIRKLDESLKVSTDLLTAEVSLLRFPPSKPGFDLFTNHRCDEHFDLQDPQSVSLSHRRMLNLLVHSLVFVEVVGDAKTFDAFMVTSDHERDRGLYQVDMAAFVELMRLVGSDWPSSARWVREPTGSGWRVWAGHGEAPDVADMVRRVR